MTKRFVSSRLWLLVVYTFWYVSDATSMLCSSRLRQRFPSSPASSGAGCDCERKTWLPASLAGCSLAGGRVRGSARSPPSLGHAAPWGFSSDESPLLHAPPQTRDASTHHASLWHGGECVSKCKHKASHWSLLLIDSYLIWGEYISSYGHWLLMGSLGKEWALSSSVVVGLVLSSSPPPQISP